MNAVILVSVISVGMAGVYGGSRTLCALSEQGYAPQIFSYIDKSGRPLAAVVALILCGPIAYINVASSGKTIFDWLLALSGLTVLFTWASICVAHIRFRAAWRHQGHTLNEIPFQAFFGVAGSVVALVLIFAVLLAQVSSALRSLPIYFINFYVLLTGSFQGYVALYPLSKGGKLGTAEDFFKAMLALPVVIFFAICGYFWKKPLWLTLDTIDLDTGRRHIDWLALRAEKERIAALPFHKRMYYLFF